MNPDLRGSAAHVVVTDLGAPQLDDDDRRHLEQVLRLRPGEVVTATDGAGRWVRCRWAGGGIVTVEGPVEHDPLPAPGVTVACAIPKGERAEWIVEKLTEIGVDRLLWLDTKRSVVRWSDDKAAKNRRRLERIARSAAMQSRRTRLLEIDGPAPLASVVAQPGVVVADPDGEPSVPPGTHTIVVGPEGGFDPSELPRDAPRVCLAAPILRVDTAAFLAGYLLISP